MATISIIFHNLTLCKPSKMILFSQIVSFLEDCGSVAFVRSQMTQHIQMKPIRCRVTRWVGQVPCFEGAAASSAHIHYPVCSICPSLPGLLVNAETFVSRLGPPVMCSLHTLCTTVWWTSTCYCYLQEFWIVNFHSPPGILSTTTTIRLYLSLIHI